MLFDLSLIAAASSIISIYLMAAIAFGILMILNSGAQTQIRVPVWFIIFCYIWFSPLILSLSLAKGFMGRFNYEQSNELYSESVDRKAESRPKEIWS
jgi:hypothetical protein